MEHYYTKGWVALDYTHVPQTLKYMMHTKPHMSILHLKEIVQSVRYSGTGNCTEDATDSFKSVWARTCLLCYINRQNQSFVQNIPINDSKVMIINYSATTQPP